MIACARDVARRGAFPSTAAGLRQLPGIGAYTSAAIAAIAFGEKVAAVDTNVARVIARLNGLKRPARGEIERLALAMMPDDRPGDFLQAMMDLGATICRPQAPRCGSCPLRSLCVAASTGSASPFPNGDGARPGRIATASLTGPSATATSGWCGARPMACLAEWRRFPARN